MSDIDDSSNTDKLDWWVPVYPDGTRIFSKDNDAAIEGKLYDYGKWSVRTGHFQPYFSDRAVLLSNGRLAVEHVSSVTFVNGIANDPRDFNNPAPPILKRVVEYNTRIAREIADAAALGLGGTVGPAAAMLTAVPAGDIALVNTMLCSKENSMLLKSLHSTFSALQNSEQMLDDANGSGYDYLLALRARCGAADSRDKAVNTARFSYLVTHGIPGVLKLESLRAFKLEYLDAKRTLPVSQRPKDEQEVEMMKLIAIKDASIRDMFELKCEIADPKTLDEVDAIIRKILSGRERAEEIDAIAAGAPPAAPALAVGRAPDDPAKGGPDAAAAAAAAAAAKKAKKAKKQREHKEREEREKKAAGRVEPPRDANDRITHWIPGMGACNGCGGNHLHRDCPEKEQSQPNSKQEGLVSASADDATILSLPNEMDDEELSKHLSTFLERLNRSDSKGSEPSPSSYSHEPTIDSYHPPPVLHQALVVMHAAEGAAVPQDGNTHVSETDGPSRTAVSDSTSLPSARGDQRGSAASDVKNLVSEHVSPGVTTSASGRLGADPACHCGSCALDLISRDPIPLLVAKAITSGLERSLAPISGVGRREDGEGAGAGNGGSGLGSEVRPAAPAKPARRIASRFLGSLSQLPAALLRRTRRPLPSPVSSDVVSSVSPTLPCTVEGQPSTRSRNPRRVLSGYVAQLRKRACDHVAPAFSSAAGPVPVPLSSVSSVPSEIIQAELSDTFDDSASVSSTDSEAADGPPSLRPNEGGETSDNDDDNDDESALLEQLAELRRLVAAKRANAVSSSSATAKPPPPPLPPPETPAQQTGGGGIRVSLDPNKPKLERRHAPSLPRPRTTTGAPGATEHELPRLSPWLPPKLRSDQARGNEVVHKVNGTLSRPPASSFVPPIAAAASPESPSAAFVSQMSDTMAILAHVDSCCTGSLTPHIGWLVNLRPCEESFVSADGKTCKATHIGDMPIISRDAQGKLAKITFSNVRCVPGFKYTLLSVNQLWNEQRIDSRFADSRRLILPGKETAHHRVAARELPFLSRKALPTIAGVSAASPSERETAKVSRFVSSLPSAALPAELLSPLDPSTAVAAVGGEVAATAAAPPQQLQPAAGGQSTVPPAAGAAPAAAGPTGKSSSPLGTHKIDSTSHVARLPAVQAAELIHRRCHAGVDKIRALANTTVDGSKNLASAPAGTASACTTCAAARIKKASHSGTLSAPAAEPGTLHFDIKELVLGVGGVRYIVFLIDEHCRFVFVDFLKAKSDAAASVLRGRAAFLAKVNAGVDSDGRPLPRPEVRIVHSDREGGLMSHYFRAFRADAAIHHETSPPHDHDLNPIAERTIGLISETASAMLADSGLPVRFWPHIVFHAVNWHNGMISSVGSSTADANISPHQRLTLKPPRVMDLAAIGCRAVALKAPKEQDKMALGLRGHIGVFLGRSLSSDVSLSTDSKGSYDVLVGNKIVTSSSVMIDEEWFDLAAEGRRHRPLTALAHAPPAPAAEPLPAPAPERGLRLLSLFSGPYARADGLKPHLTGLNWSSVEQFDCDGERGGGWEHDLLNDSTYASILARAINGELDAIMVAFPCSTFSVTRFFDASTDDDDRGPPVIRTAAFPDGLPKDQIDPRHLRELQMSNLLLQRTARVITAARKSERKTTIIFENPADRSLEDSPCSSPEFSDHGSVFATTPFKRLHSEADLVSSATFAYCSLGSEYQKYTTLWYTPEAGPVLDQLKAPEFQCNHPRGAHSKQAGGRGPGGNFVSGDAAAYPTKLNEILAQAFTVARTGSSGPAARQLPLVEPPAAAQSPQGPAAPSSAWEGAPSPPVFAPTPATGGVISPAGAAARPLGPPPSAAAAGRSPSVRPFPDLGSVHSVRPSPAVPPSRIESTPSAKSTSILPDSAPRVHSRAVRGHARAGNRSAAGEATAPALTHAFDSSVSPTRAARAARRLHPVLEETSGSAADSMESFVASMAFAALHDASGKMEAATEDEDTFEVPVTDWSPVSPARLEALMAGLAADDPSISQRLDEYTREVPIAVAGDESPDDFDVQVALLLVALRADSPDAPATHAEAMKRGFVWVKAEATEIGNHKKNASWRLVPRSQVPKGRRIHRMIWVYKMKRDGTAKARLCVQGSSLEEGIDFDQVFSAALRYSSARGLFAYAARTGCGVRSVDLVAAYLQGKFLDGEVVFCHQPQGHVELAANGEPLIARIEKPIYGIQQAGRRLQRLLFAWLRDRGLKPLDDSDPCVFVRDGDDGEDFKIGVYVDNLQIVHSVALDANGRGPDGCFYNSFMDKLREDWDVTDEGPMDDLLGIEVRRNADGSITLHQEKYIRKICKRFLPDGPTNRVQRGSLPYSSDFMRHYGDACAQETCEYPHLVQTMQERVGSLMYAATSTRPDISFVVQKLCKCMTKPTPEMIRETEHVFSYLERHAACGLTYTKGYERLKGFSDASWETRNSTSGWLVLFQSAALSWGSRGQKSIALSTCEAEIIALSEAAKDVVYQRKFVAGIGAPEVGPTSLSCDSKAAVDSSYNPEHHDKMKHVERRHFFIRDMVEKFELVVPFVRTHEQLADILTKPMKNATQFHYLRRIIMNDADAVDMPSAPRRKPTSRRGGASESEAASRAPSSRACTEKPVVL